MVWRDPLRGLHHDLFELIEVLNMQRLVGYETTCGIKLTVDDVNKTNLVLGEPTCLACVVGAKLQRKE